MPDFPYINARVRAMRSRLLSSSQLEDLLAAPTMAAFLQALAATPYATDLQEALVRFEGLQAVDTALAHNLQRTTRAILGFADGGPRALIEIILLRYDLVNLRTIVRGKHAGRSAEDVMQAVLPAGTLGEMVLKEMAEMPDLTGLAGTLEAVGHPLAGALAEGVAAYVDSKDLAGLEMRLDRGYLEHALRRTARAGSNGRELREILQAEADVTNAKTAARLAMAGDLDEDRRLQYYIAGGKIISEDTFASLSSAQSQAQVWPRLHMGGFPLREPPTDLIAFERTLDLTMAKALAQRFRGDPLGIDVVVGYLALKSAEVANLRLIARGKFLSLPREAVRREMVLV
jgi:V/A-type H+-transporting ATPase subunit C